MPKKTSDKEIKEKNIKASGKKAPKEVPLKQTPQYIDTLIQILEQHYPDVETALTHTNPFEMLVATILSAQTTDKQVNRITPALFEKYPTPEKLAAAKEEDIFEAIRSTGYYKSKGRNIKAMAEVLNEKYGGTVPNTLEELTQLPGVGRKTANVVMGSAFGIPSGVVVDTHVHRLSHRLGLTKAKTPEKIEQDLINLIPKEKWIWFSHALITHGRTICTAKSPNCKNCPLNTQCPSAYTF